MSKSELKKFRETLETGRPEVVAVVGEWLQSVLQSVEPPKVIECPYCSKEISL